ncbi:MAG: acyl-CoA dehydrogenase, partial [Gammaproteobacteria bacterium]
MPNYKAPLRDMQFVYHELLAAENINQLPGMDEFSPDIINAVLEEASKICEELLFPLNRTGDEEGCHFEEGKVTVPKGFDEAYQQYKIAGWPSLMASQEFGGQGFPHSLYMLFGEMLCSSNLSFAMYPELTYGACNAISRFGSDEVKQKFMPKMIEGEWSGTMCLTEP